MKISHFFKFITCFFLFIISVPTFGQVTIGSSTLPIKGALLDLKETNASSVGGATAEKGLLLPRVPLSDRTNLFPMFDSDGQDGYIGATKADEDKKHTGLWVYNISSVGEFYPGIYFWDGMQWQPLIENDCVLVTGLRIEGPTTIRFAQTSSLYTAVHNEANEGDIVYQWSVDSGSGFQEINGATSKIYSFTPELQGTYKLQCRAQSNCKYPKPQFDEIVITVGPPYTSALDGSKLADILGKYCFDVAETNSAPGSGGVTARISQRTDFSKRTAQAEFLPETSFRPGAGEGYRYTGVQEYALRAIDPANELKNIIYFIVDKNDDSLVEMVDPEDGHNGKTIKANTEIKDLPFYVIHFKRDLNARLRGVSRDDALRMSLIAVFTFGNKTYKVELKMSFQDASCCGAYIATDTWLPMMCHNLGTDENADPLVPSMKLIGDYYQYGSSEEKIKLLIPAKDEVIDPKSPAVWGPNSVQCTNFFPMIGKEENNYWARSNDFAESGNNGWVSPGVDAQGKTIKGVDDPCPPGWRLPTRQELEGAIQYAKDTKTLRKVGAKRPKPSSTYHKYYFENGIYLGEFLFLPAQYRIYTNNAVNPGERIGMMDQIGKFVFYWTSQNVTAVVSDVSGSYHEVVVVDKSEGNEKYWGAGVRCVSE